MTSFSPDAAPLLFLINCSMFFFMLLEGILLLAFYTLNSVLSNFAIIVPRKKESWILCFNCLSDVF